MRRSMISRQLAGVALLGASMVAVPGHAQQTDFTFYSPLAEDWYQARQTFEWTSTTVNNNGQRVRVSYRTFGYRSNPAIVMLHGYPTSSFDFREMIEFLFFGHSDIADMVFPGAVQYSTSGYVIRR